MDNTQGSSSSLPLDRESGLDLTIPVLTALGGLLIGCVVSFQGLDYCPNDASRWDTIYFLVEHGTYAFKTDHGASWSRPRNIDPQSVPAKERGDLFVTEGKYYLAAVYMPLFPTIDMVRLGDKYYSSKPPLLPTCIAGIVWVIQKLTGTTFREHPWFIMRTTLIIVQVVPLLLAIYVLSLHIPQLTTSVFARDFCIIATAFGTYLTPWSVTLNNHVIAACCVVFALHATIRIWYDGRREWYWFAMAGFFGSLAAANELPAAILAATVLIALAYRSVGRAGIAALAAAIPAAAFLGTNVIATGSIIPAYAGFGKPGGPYVYPGSYWLKPEGMDALQEPWWFYQANILIGHHGFFVLTPIFLLSIVGIAMHLKPRPEARTALAAFVLLTTSLIACFYTFYTSESRNYGGTTQGPRWMFWLIPLWLLFLPPGVQKVQAMRGGRALCHILLAVSLFGTGYALRQPWSAPWLHVLFRQFGWINY